MTGTHHHAMLRSSDGFAMTRSTRVGATTQGHHRGNLESSMPEQSNEGVGLIGDPH